MVIHQPAKEQALLSPSREPVTRLSFVRVTMTHCISYVQCHEKVVKSFKTRPHELTVLGLSVFSRRHGQLVGPLTPSWWFLVFASIARGFQGGVWFVLSCVPCVPCSPVLPLLLWVSALRGQAVSSRRLGARW
jgi:hypothetical protein